MLYTDGNGFPLAIKPSHLYGSNERMDTAEVLSAIVEEACRYVPEASVGVTDVKKPKRLTSVEFKEARTSVDDQKEALTSVTKVPIVAASSNFVRSNRIELACFKVVVGLLSICLV